MATRQRRITDEQFREHATLLRARSGRKAVVRVVSLQLAVALNVSELDARRLLERVAALMDDGEIVLDIYRRLNPTTHRSARDGHDSSAV